MLTFFTFTIMIGKIPIVVKPYATYGHPPGTARPRLHPLIFFLDLDTHSNTPHPLSTPYI